MSALLVSLVIVGAGMFAAAGMLGARWDREERAERPDPRAVDTEPWTAP